jgi:hypothetical protein
MGGKREVTLNRVLSHSLSLSHTCAHTLSLSLKHTRLCIYVNAMSGKNWAAVVPNCPELPALWKALE